RSSTSPPTGVSWGRGPRPRGGARPRELGGRRVLLVTDPGLESAGHPQRARDYLLDAGMAVFVFDDVEENPTTRHVAACQSFAQKHHVDFIVAIGGGSAMDCAKGANFLLTNGGQMADYKGFGKATKPMLPSITVPTTAGTGSEAQSYALIADEKSHMKMACGDRKAAFRVAILDPEVTVTQPPRVTAVTGIDAIAHAVESFVCSRRNPMSQMLARAAWGMLEPTFETVLRDPNDLEARGAMQLGANLAGSAIENSMLGAAHACANPLTAHYGLTHGIAVGILLPHVIRFNAPAVAELYAELSHETGLSNGDLTISAETLAQRITELLTLAGLPTTLSECGVSETILPLLAEEAAGQWTARFNPRPVTEKELLQLYQAAL
ncbi:MAG: iron-containing alcohol dehydrogenase, partial [Gemmataceae bacterium]|nr:iron-containing alcohol dehydrogenase [Gemmataceae bacterium]MDW8266468.1 iron-containing alcohol dehydrogenase [Gemmataceae bacterium]